MSAVPENLRRLMDLIDEHKEAMPEVAYLEAGRLLADMHQPAQLNHIPRFMPRDIIEQEQEPDTVHEDDENDTERMMIQQVQNELADFMDIRDYFILAEESKLFIGPLVDRLNGITIRIERGHYYGYMTKKMKTALNIIVANKHRFSELGDVFEERGRQMSRLKHAYNLIKLAINTIVDTDIFEIFNQPAILNS
jgi:hypothetical protein